MSLNSFKDLVVWQKSRLLVKEVYDLCSLLPSSEKFGLSSQMQRSSISIPSNIAEGYRRHNTKEYNQFLGIAAGSAAELETQLILVSDIYHLDTSKILNNLEEIQKMLFALSKKLYPKP
ncbi:MAG: four helix bundle protein [Patescibacteria group bacterium]|jgi:four helix bundle protein|nr:four helix bundle protein [Patescibacteria group bacterium]